MFCRRNVLLLLFSLSVALSARAQVGQSPYTIRGIGNINSLATANNVGMGGVGIGTVDKRFISLQNPALLGYDVYLTSIMAGFSLESRQLATENEQDRLSSGGLDYIAIAFPVYRFPRDFSKEQTRGIGLSVGLAPYSTVSYNLSTSQPIAGSALNEQMSVLYQGSGGLTRAYAATGIHLFQGLTIGARASYIFGGITEEFTSGIVTSSLDPRNYTVRFEERTNFSDLLLSGGLAYRKKLDKTKGTFVMAGATYEQEKDLSADRIFITTRNQPIGSGSLAVRDTLTDQDARVRLPASLGVGVSYGKVYSYLLGADFKTQDWTEYRNSEAAREEGLGNSYSVALGGEWIPDYFSRNYFQRMSYRTGIQYEKTPFLINGEEIKQIGINFGVTFPVGASGFHTSFTWGQRGTTDNGLIRERFFRLNLGVTLNERWFERYKYD